MAFLAALGSAGGAAGGAGAASALGGLSGGGSILGAILANEATKSLGGGPLGQRVGGYLGDLSNQSLGGWGTDSNYMPNQSFSSFYKPFEFLSRRQNSYSNSFFNDEPYKLSVTGGLRYPSYFSGPDKNIFYR